MWRNNELVQTQSTMVDALSTVSACGKNHHSNDIHFECTNTNINSHSHSCTQTRMVGVYATVLLLTKLLVSEYGACTRTHALNSHTYTQTKRRPVRSSWIRFIDVFVCVRVCRWIQSMRKTATPCEYTKWLDVRMMCTGAAKQKRQPYHRGCEWCACVDVCAHTPMCECTCVVVCNEYIANIQKETIKWAGERWCRKSAMYFFIDKFSKPFFSGNYHNIYLWWN